jgi:hypothetical protein
VRAGLALVVFGDATTLRWLRLLRPGFRHCFLAVNDGRHWITYDPLCHSTEIAVQPVPAAFDLAAWYRAQGHVVVETRIRRGNGGDGRGTMPWRPFTCVEAVKRALGLDAPDVWTPWQLYRHLLREDALDA